jgi:antitoxin component of MazEF toxin-antitoxin module
MEQKTLLLAIRQALIIALGALEDFLKMERSIIPQRKRRKRRYERREEDNEITPLSTEQEP